MKLLLAVSLLLSVASAVPWQTQPQAKLLPGTTQGGGNGLPILKLDYAAYQAFAYNASTDVYIFKNIRFAAPPLGPLRWRKPQPPLREEGIQTGAYGPHCYQAKTPYGNAYNTTVASEDCLFLDLYLPGKAVKNPHAKLPVVVWVYGGSYIAGSKDLRSNGSPSGVPIINAADGNLVYVAGNYRLGAFGFLAGSTVEREGVPNAGLWDQHAVFEWVQRYISHVGGDKNMVTAWGESAGAGSIMQHLVFDGGRMDPLFHRINVQSPALQAVQDVCGTVEAAYKQFAGKVGCRRGGLECLRAKDTMALLKANSNTTLGGRPGSIGYGPTVDGKLLRRLAQLELASGNYWKGIQSVITLHDRDEAYSFTNPNTTTEKLFNHWLDGIYPTNNRGRSFIASIKRMYPLSAYRNETDRVKDITRDSSFACNNRYIGEAYPDRTWNGEYAVTPGTHGSDVDATFSNNTGLLHANPAPWQLLYQKYFTSHALTGNPNTLRHPGSIEWPMSLNYKEQSVPNLMVITNTTGFFLKNDQQVPKTKCEFWRELNRQLPQAYPACSAKAPTSLAFADAYGNPFEDNITPQRDPAYTE